QEHLGVAPIRYRDNSARLLLLYRTDEIIKKRRIAFRISGVDKTQAVEILGPGNYTNVDGIHPSGARYKWRNGHPFELTMQGLTLVTLEQVEKFWAELGDYLTTFHEVVRDTTRAGSTTTGERKALSNSNLHAPDPRDVLALLKAVPCDSNTFPDRDSFLRVFA